MSLLLLFQGATSTYTLDLQAGSYTYTGQSATIERDRVLTASAGSYTYTGQSVTILRKRYLDASAGSYVITGQDATILRNRVLSASVGSYLYTGQSSALSHGYVLVASPGSYTLDGQSVDITVAAASEEPQPQGGGRGSRKKKRTYIEREGKILVFDGTEDAIAYLEAERAIEKAKAASKPVKKVRVRSAPVEIDLSRWEGIQAILRGPIEEAINTEAFEKWLRDYEIEQDDEPITLKGN